MRSNLINNFTEKTKGDNVGCHIIELPCVEPTENINKRQKYFFESHARYHNATKINHRILVIQDKPIGKQKGRPKKGDTSSSKKK